MQKKVIRKYLIRLPVLATAAVVMALSMQVFILPARFAPSGVSGLASITQVLSGFPAGYMLFILNVPLVVVSYFFIRRSFAVETLTYVLLSSAFTELFRLVNLYQYTDDLLLAALAGGVLNGLCIGILFKAGASSGGTDIVGLLVQKKFRDVSISWIILSVNIVIVLFGGVMYLTVLKISLTSVISIVLFSFILQFITSKVMEIIINGLSSAVKFEIITTKPEELSRAIIASLHRGVTVVKSTGAYANTDNNILICIVRRRQITAFKKLLKSIDPNAFAYSMQTREVMGNGFND